MKKIVLLLAFLPVYVLAQSKIEPELKVSYELGVDEYKNQSFGAELILGYRASDQFRIGVGTGIYWCKHLYENASIVGSHYYEEYRETASYIPMFLDVKYNFITGNISPYLRVDVGYSLFNSASDYADNNKLGFMTNPAFGVDFNVGKGCLFLEVGYKYQDRKLFEEKEGYSQTTFSVGSHF